MIRRITSSFVLCTALLATACIVTDQIEFEDLVNNPPEVLWFDPSNEEIAQVCDTYDLVFKVGIWDPDARDAATYAARLFIWIDPSSAATPSQPRECDVKPLSTTEGAQVEGLETGVQREVECKIDLKLYGGLEGQLLLIKVQVSDLGYAAQSTLPVGARAAEVLWVLEVLPDDWCP